jgi:hypothetical protein
LVFLLDGVFDRQSRLYEDKIGMCL